MIARAASSVGVLVALVAGAAHGQAFYARGDAICSLRPTAADVLAEIRALGGISVCNNDDCDRDGAVTAADVGCAATCLFGQCAIPAHAPQISSVSPDSAPGIVPLSAIQIAGVNFGSADHIKRVTIGGREPQIAAFDPAMGTLQVIVPAGLPPGPVAVVVFDGELSGPPSSIAIAAPMPSGSNDTFDGILGLSDTVASLLLASNLESTYSADDAAALRDQLQQYRTQLATERAALASDPGYTDDVRARFDAAFDSAGIAGQLRSLIADIENLLGAQAATRITAADPATTLAVAVSRFAATEAILAAEASSTAPLIAAPAAAAATLSLPVILAVAAAAALLAGGAYLAGRNWRPPEIISITFEDGNGRGRLKPTAGGVVRVAGKNFQPSADIVVQSAYGEFTAQRLEVTDEFISGQLPSGAGLCGAVSIAVVKSLGVRTNPYFTAIQPILNEVRLVAPEGNTDTGGQMERALRDAPSDLAKAGEEIDLVVRGAAPCAALIPFKGPVSLDDDEAVYNQLPLVTLLTTSLPPFPPGGYTVGTKIQDLASDEQLPITVGNPIADLHVSCTATQLALPPGSPATAMCSADVLPKGEVAPINSKFVWSSDSGSVGVTNSDSLDLSVTRTTTISPQKLGAAKIHAAVVFGSQTLAQSSMDVDVTVVDKTAPTLSISSTSGPTIMPGGSIDISVMAEDNVGVAAIALKATGDAVTNPEQESDCAGSKMCSATFTLNLKDMGFKDSTISVHAEAMDAAKNQASSDTLTFTFGKDTTCPIVTINTPANSDVVDAGSTVQVIATATDDAGNDTGVKKWVYSATGDALVAPVSQTQTLADAMPSAQLNFTFMVKKAEDLAMVMNKSIAVSVAAADNAMPPNQCDPQTIALNVSGALNNCQGSITTDNPEGFDGEPFTITVTVTGDAAAKVTKVISTNPGGEFDLVSQGNGVYTVTLFYEGDGGFTLTMMALDMDGNTLCAGSIGLEALGAEPESVLEPLSLLSAPPAGAVTAR